MRRPKQFAPDAVLSPKEAAAYLRLSLPTLRRSDIPVVRITERKRGYRFATLQAYLAGREG